MYRIDLRQWLAEIFSRDGVWKNISATAGLAALFFGGGG
jgi:hypothetical protein